MPAGACRLLPCHVSPWQPLCLPPRSVTGDSRIACLLTPSRWLPADRQLSNKLETAGQGAGNVSSQVNQLSNIHPSNLCDLHLQDTLMLHVSAAHYTSWNIMCALNSWSLMSIPGHTHIVERLHGAWQGSLWLSMVCKYFCGSPYTMIVVLCRNKTKCTCLNMISYLASIWVCSVFWDQLSEIDLQISGQMMICCKLWTETVSGHYT